MKVAVMDCLYTYPLKGKYNNFRVLRSPVPEIDENVSKLFTFNDNIISIHTKLIIKHNK